ncbi:hypothetical protein QQS21_002893 [Conoideocrella luteorostrata]|uniref:glycerophosphodiester phosphodiesterase n=1 Tax=Conoideocrella luteorostrata TaxID=1105319 RepID=A0AAJ0CYC6_9HYPO|nr:hypothetical protein QQS21_002893 [Conoideocrella luteorostrata]
MHAIISSLLAGFVAVGQVSGSPCPSHPKPIKHIDLGPRPYYLVNNMTDGPLKSKLASCKEMTMKPSTFSIGHRGGACLQFPEHSKESNMAGARMGAGVLECDVTFTKDRQLVCRHSQCDLHTTTNIVNIPTLNAKCTKPFSPAKDGKPASAKCCTSDITLSEYKSLCAKMDGSNATATTPKDFLGGTPSWRTDLYATCGKLMELKEHIAMVEALGLHHTPELKAPEVPMPFAGNYTHEMFAQQMIDAYKKAGIPAARVMSQSFEAKSLRYWLKNEPEFGKTAILLDESGDKPGQMAEAVKNLTLYAKEGIKTMAPPMHYLVEVQNGTMAPSAYANKAKELGLRLISWSLERSGPLAAVHAKGDYYYTSVQDVVTKDGDMYEYVDVLARQVGVAGMFSDWSGTVTYYANCFGLQLT